MVENISKNYVEHDEQGRIIAHWKVSQDIYELNKNSKSLISGVADTNQHYIKDGRITDRPPQQTAYYKSKLFRLPTPCTIYINGAAYECTDTIAELDLVAGLKRHIRVVSFPFLDWEIEIED